MKIYVISLENQKERRRQIADQLHQLGLEFEFFDAINMVNNSELILSSIDNQKSKSYIGREMSNVEAACSLSHRSVAEKFLSTNEEICLVLEDDAEIDHGILKLINHLKMVEKSFDVILLGYCKLKKELYDKFYKREPIYNVKFRVDEFEIGKVGKNWTSGAVGYFLTKSGANKVIDFHNEIYTLADQWNIFERDYDLNIYHCRPLVVHEKFLSLKSSLEEERSAKIRIKKSHLKDYFNVSIKIFLININLYYPLCRIYLKLTKNG